MLISYFIAQAAIVTVNNFEDIRSGTTSSAIQGRLECPLHQSWVIRRRNMKCWTGNTVWSPDVKHHRRQRLLTNTVDWRTDLMPA